MSLVVPELPSSWALTAFDRGLLGGIVFVGFSVGAALFGVLSDSYFGRARMISACLVIAAIFGFLSGAAGSFGSLMALRALFGIGVGGFLPVSTTLFIESTTDKHVATLIGLLGNCFTLGGVIISLLAIGVLPSLGWRWILCLSAIPLVPALVASAWLCESPMWLVSSGRMEEAHAVLAYTSRMNGIPSVPPLRPPSAKHPAPTLAVQLGIIWNDHRSAILTLMLTWFTINWVYYGTIYVLPIVLKEHTPNEYVGVLLTAISEFPGNTGAGFLSNRIGRKPTFILCMAISCVGALFCGIAAEWLSSGWLNFATVIFKIGTTGAFTMCYIYTPEVFPTSLRATCFGICQFCGRIAAAATPIIAQLLVTSTSSFATFSVYVGVCLFSVLVTVLLPYETLGRNADEVEEERKGETFPLVTAPMGKPASGSSKV